MGVSVGEKNEQTPALLLQQARALALAQPETARERETSAPSRPMWAVSTEEKGEIIFFWRTYPNTFTKDLR
jgi:hypothetical protein